MKAESLFSVLLLIITSVLSDRINIVAISESKPWISTENFTHMIQKSFLYSKCCNVYLSESIHDVETLFKQFINIYPFTYLLRRKIYDCMGYFLLGPTDKEIEEAMREVPSSISTTEILIVVNGELKNNSRLFNVSLYENSNTNIVSKSGIWRLSENYLEPRFFVKVDSYEKLRHEYNTINMRGRTLRVSTFYRPPVTYLERTVNKTINGIEEEVFLADNDKENDGVEMKIFFILAEKLNFTWRIRKPGGKYRFGRRVNSTTWNGGVVQLLLEDKIDMAFANMWLTANHNAFVNMSEPWYQLSIHFLVPRPQTITSFWALTRPFPEKAWLLLIAMFFFESIYMYVRAWIDPKFPRRFRSFLLTITELMGRLLGTWIPKNTANARFELHLWQTASFVLVTSYCSSLASRLASTEYEQRIDTIRQFLEVNLTWGRKGQQPAYYDYFDLEDFYASQLPSRYHSVKDDEDTHRFIERGNFAIVGRIVDKLFFPEDEVSNKDLANYRVMKEGVGKFYSSFALKPWLLVPVNKIILSLKESGIIHFYLNDVIRRRTSVNLRRVVKEYDGFDRTARVLGLMPLGAGFATLIIGLLISIIVFFYELKRAGNSRSIADVLRKIRKKRAATRLSTCKRNACREKVDNIKHNSKIANLAVIRFNHQLTNIKFHNKSD